MLTDEEVKYGYWEEKWANGKLPHPIIELNEYRGEAALNISCTELVATAHEKYQKRIVSEWCESLPYLDNVRTLCFNTRVSQRLFDAVSLMPNLEALYVKWGGIKSVASLASHSRLRILTIGSNPSIQDVELLGNIAGLDVLALENIPGAYTLDFLRGLGNLEALGVDGSMWKTQWVESLQPLEYLQKLKFLSLINTRVKYGGLYPLLKLKSLVHVRTALFHTVKEFTSLRTELPLLAYGTALDEDTIDKYAKQ